MNNQDSFDATQRVSVDSSGRSEPQNPQSPRPRAARPSSAQRALQKKRRQRATVITLVIILLLLLIAVLAVAIMALYTPDEDDGLIVNNIYAAGVNLGGLTPEEARAKLKNSTDHTYSKLDMTVSVLDTTLKLSPADTGAQLDVDGVIEAAYNYGRTGSRTEQQRARLQAQNNGYTISILPYLDLNTDYIHSALNELGLQYSSMLSESSYRLVGLRPALSQEVYDTTVAYQTLIIQLGTAEYNLNTTTLYQQIMDAYEINIFQVTGECTVLAPESLDYEAIYEYCHCVAPVNAQFNTDTYEVTKEVYGYGFSIEDVKAAVEAAEYGQEISIPLTFLEPDITSEFYSGDMFQHVLSTYGTPTSTDNSWNVNMRLACELLDGTIIRAGEEFSFNSIVGEPTSRRGFQSTGVYLGKAYRQLIGGGLCQVASTLYYCALMAELEISEHHAHSYVTDYIAAGFDAEVYYNGDMDLRFRNNTDKPLRINAEVYNGEIRITLIGTDTREYIHELNVVINQTFNPEIVYNTMLENNPQGYVEGDVLRAGITGYTLSTYSIHYDMETGEVLEERLLAEFYYAKQDQVSVQIYQPPVEVPPDSTDPTNPDPTDPSNPDPTDPSDPDPTDPTGSTDSVENTAPSVSEGADDPSVP